ncbi:MAG: polyketide cyclase [Prevotellaceae bacterium]|jgi:carbon monoxide dehydrogenase subunit G|nr:polyketide cyclase [Prevotellaceae bacterium]
MDEFISETVQIRRRAEHVYALLADMSFFAQAVASAQFGEQMKDIEDFRSDRDSCSFKVKGVDVGIQIIDREPFKTIKYTGCGQIPFNFFIWIQLKELAPDDTRMRIVLHAKLNLMMKAMFKNKIKTGINQIANQLANSLNA